MAQEPLPLCAAQSAAFRRPPVLFCQRHYAQRFFGSGLVYKNTFFPFLSLFFVCFLPLANSISPRRRNYPMRLITHLSVISYSVYLLHFSVVMTLQNYIYAPATFEEALLAIAVFYLATFLLSTMVYNFYEKPCTRLRDKFSMSGIKQVVTFR